MSLTEVIDKIEYRTLQRALGKQDISNQNIDALVTRTEKWEKNVVNLRIFFSIITLGVLNVFYFFGALAKNAWLQHQGKKANLVSLDFVKAHKKEAEKVIREFNTVKSSLGSIEDDVRESDQSEKTPVDEEEEVNKEEEHKEKSSRKKVTLKNLGKSHSFSLPAAEKTRERSNTNPDGLKVNFSLTYTKTLDELRDTANTTGGSDVEFYGIGGAALDELDFDPKSSLSEVEKIDTEDSSSSELPPPNDTYIDLSEGSAKEDPEDLLGLGLGEGEKSEEKKTTTPPQKPNDTFIDVSGGDSNEDAEELLGGKEKGWGDTAAGVMNGALSFVARAGTAIIMNFTGDTKEEDDLEKQLGKV